MSSRNRSIPYNPGTLANAARPTHSVSTLTVRLVLDMGGEVFNPSNWGTGELVDGELLEGTDLFFVRNVAPESTYQAGVYRVAGDQAELVVLATGLYSQGYRLISAAEGDDNSGPWTLAEDGTASQGNSFTPEPITGIAAVRYVIACNVKDVDLWVQVHDSAGVPVNGSVPLMTLKAPAQQTVSFDFGTDGRPLLTGGLYVCASTTAATKTLDSTSAFLFDLTYTKG